MSVEWLPGAISAGSGLLGAILSYRSNQDLQSLQKQIYLDEYNRNTPQWTVANKQAAGLNPYGDISSFGSVPVPNFQSAAAGVPESLGLMSQGLNQITDTYFGKLSYRIQKKQLELEEKSLDYELKNLEARTQGQNLDNVFKEIQNYIANATKDDKVKLSDTELQNALENLSQLIIRGDYLEDNLKNSNELLDSQIKYVLSQVSSNNYDTNIYKPGLLKIQQDVEARNKEIYETSKESSKFDTMAKTEFNKMIQNIDNSKMNPTAKGILKVLLYFGFMFVSSSANKGYNFQ